ncbi:hypothetical protein A1QO_02725 [Vibrio genomosp. F10 str. ZF-129]|uniref:Uncharacterized protein n=1 Tax=Vibrio genomosp. F10 str. ZF-129 TaxID=1187848 RepID=A0A1E5BKD3_9VIBR|nr:hypothetical protein [Vibrio genomosp. F10]OEE38312.1 hypothetical protein A1QO_02725 [Vibrio genomosp. F10 str. ZF-129]
MKFFATFSHQPFHGQISLIPDKQSLFDIVHSRAKFLGLLDDANGHALPTSEFTESELVDIHERVTLHTVVVLVDSLDELKSLSMDSDYQQLCETFIKHHGLDGAQPLICTRRDMSSILALFKSEGINPHDKDRCLESLSQTVMPTGNSNKYLRWLATQ